MHDGSAVAGSGTAGRGGSLKPHLAVFCVYVAYAIFLFPQDYATLVLRTAAQLTGLTVLLAAGLIYLAVRRQSPLAPRAAFMGIIRGRSEILLTGILAFIFGLTAFTAFKVNIPNMVPFYADPVLAWVDRSLHGGNPWEVAFSIPREFASVIGFFYGRLWALALIVTYLAALSLMNMRALSRYLWTAMFVYIGLGNVVALIFSSVGPIFYTDFYPDAYNFAELRNAVFGNSYLGTMQMYTNYLLDSYKSDGPNFGSGISAFPSVHVGVATMTAWVLTSLGRLGAVAGWTFYAVIEFGSIYTGWHYGIGGYFSTIVVSLFWIAISRYYDLPLVPRRMRDVAAPFPS